MGSSWVAMVLDSSTSSSTLSLASVSLAVTVVTSRLSEVGPAYIWQLYRA